VKKGDSLNVSVSEKEMQDTQKEIAYAFQCDRGKQYYHRAQSIPNGHSEKSEFVSHPDESLSQLATQLRNGDKVALDPLVLGLDHLGEAIFAGGVILGRVSSCIVGSHGRGSLRFLFGFLGG